MKKLLLGLVALVSMSNMSAYKINVMNTTDGSILVTVRYGETHIVDKNGHDLCDKDTMAIDSGASKSIESSACCAKTITVTAINGSASDKSINYAAPQTGFGLSCRELNFKVSNPSRGQLAAETVK
jgi:hypothetical protein